MTLTATKPTESVTSHRARELDESAEPGWIARWARRDPVRAVATVLIVVQLAVRADIASRGYLAVDDFVLASYAAGSKLDADFVFGVYINHMMPAPMLITWLITRATGLAFWPYVLLLLAGQVFLSVAFYRLLRLLLRPGWGLLVPLCLLLFSPLTLETTSWWWSGVNVLPMQLAMVLAIGAQARYVRTRRLRHLVTLALSMVLGLLFFEKSILIAPLVFFVTACLFVRGGPVRSITRTVWRYWPSWLVLTVLGSAYLWLYVSRAESSLRVPASPGEVLTFLRQLIGNTLIPGLFGGPWGWLDVPGDGAPLAAAGDLARWLAWALLLILMVVTVLIRGAAVRAWVLLATYVALVAILLGATRLGSAFSAAAGLVPRYVSDVVVVAALCVGVALIGLIDWPEQAPGQPRAWLAAARDPGAIAVSLVFVVAGLLALGLGTAWSTARFADDWAIKRGRDYLHIAQAELAKAPPGTVFFDLPVPADVMGPIFAPFNLQSHFFRPLASRPVFVTEAESPSIFDQAGHIRPAKVDGPSTAPGSVPGCGLQVTGGTTVRMPLTSPLYAWHWFVRIGYLSSADSSAVLRFGDAVHRFEVRRGLHQIYFPIVGGADGFDLTVNDTAATVCVDQVTVGNLAPRAP